MHHHRRAQFHEQVNSWHHVWSEAILSFVLALLLLVTPVSAAQMRLQDRSLYVQNNTPSVETSYTVSFRYMSPESIGSVSFLFCVDPIPYHECVTPPGLDVSGATLVDQSGESGFTILSKSTNHIVLTRPAGPITSAMSSYKFDNIINPSNTDLSFSVRLRTHATPNATGTQIDFGSVKGQITEGILIETQVPPMLIFCLAEEVADNCASTNETFYKDMGTLEPATTLSAQSQMAVGTNATGGFAITASGIPPSAGTNVIEPLLLSTESKPGSNQFGINLVANNAPAVGIDPQGIWANAIVASDYNVPNKYKYVSGDLVAYSPNVSLMKKFTVSYILNTSDELKAGVYSTTITYIASGRF